MSVWIDVVFPAVMIAFPLVFVLATRPAPEGEAAGRRVAVLAAATLASLAAVGLARALAGPGLARWAWPMFFPLWFGLAMPALAVRRPLWFRSHPGGRVRAASLTSRRRAVEVRGGVLAAAWTVLILGLLAIGLRPVADMDRAAWIRWVVSLTVFLAVEPWILLLLPRWIRAVGQEPEPLGEGGSPDLVEEYRRSRVSRARGLAVLSLVILVVVTSGLVTLVWAPPGAAMVLGIGGAVTGTIVGIAGAVFGTVATLQRERIARRLG